MTNKRNELEELSMRYLEMSNRLDFVKSKIGGYISNMNKLMVQIESMRNEANDRHTEYVNKAREVVDRD